MSLITTCPSCGTRFRVVADQLRVSEGWVRCGQCQDVFDARQHMDADAAPAKAEEPLPVDPPVAVVEPQPQSPAGPTAADVSAAAAFTPLPMPAAAVAAPPGYELPVPAWDEDSDFPHVDAAAEAVLPQPPAGLESSTSAFSPAASDTAAEPVWDETAFSRTVDAHEVLPIEEQEAPDSLPVQTWSAPADLTETPAPSEPAWTEPVPEHVPEPDEPVAPLAPEHAPTAQAEVHPTAVVEALTTAAAIESAAQKLMQAETHAAGAAGAAMPSLFAPQEVDVELADIDPALEPGFVRAARRQAWWQKPLVRVAMGAAVVVLPVALVLQVALHERNALVAWQPDLRPALEFMCTALQCHLGPRQQIAAMVVSGSAFTKTDTERSYQLSLSIQNQSRAPVGMPAVELTLTDAQDQAIARKVITAKELAAPQELRAGAEWSAMLPVTTPGLNLQVAGYRVLLFYP
ncbi:DUF3426 domain-containing protein [Comamonas sp. GB3 AK4-5]|uniref:zinc-ribbon and DUF3426 domain-containing protein n=1 Tax=Comamonas sp. GB3 AK4-5 TaxID=3231487 RepID=UPI00351EB04E